MIKNYLLNESPLYGYNRPKLWIHSKYEINSRKWKDFYSRNTTDLNQDYIHLTIKTIINHCGEDFNICLIDDDSFGKLLPNWDVDLMNMAEPRKSNYRAMGMAQLIYVYGGMTLPNSFVCLKNLKDFMMNIQQRMLHLYANLSIEHLIYLKVLQNVLSQILLLWVQTKTIILC